MDKMPKKMLIDATHAEETRVVVVDGNKVEEFDFESQFKRQLAGNIYLAKVTRVEPSLQAAFVDYGGNRHGFLAFAEIHPDYYQIPVADREALMAEERAYAESLKAEEDEEDAPKQPRRRTRSKSRAAPVEGSDAVVTSGDDPVGLETIDLDDDLEGSSPMELVGETPVETPAADEDIDDATADDAIESVAETDDIDDMRPVRKPRPRRYKIQEVIKVRQILLIQVVKEERGNKGAALTTYLSLAGRYCVLMPNTARGGGISRKITNAVDRKKLKEIASEMTVPDGAGLIIRTAGSQRTKAEIKRDYEYLQRMWEQIRELTLKSIAPARIYEEGDLIKRSIRDLYSKDIDEVIVAGEAGYRSAKDFMRMIMPSHAKNVKFYAEPMPIYARYQVETYLAGMFNPTVQLPSGGYIVIGITEALVAIDVNSGRATKEGSIEQTALKTNLEAADEVARQLRLRDLAGLIVIDFIDMDERKNNAAVEKRFKDKLKTDRARIQVGRISGFGLMEMSRQRLRPGMLEATTQMCSHCHGTGLLRSDDNVALSILRQLEEEGVRARSKEVLVRAPIAIANFLMNGKRENIAEIEACYGMSVRVECDPVLISPDFVVEKFKTATRIVPEAAPIVASALLMDDDEDDDLIIETPDEDEEDAVAPTPKAAAAVLDAPEADGEDRPKRKRRRRRRRRTGAGDAPQAEGAEPSDAEDEALPLSEPATASATEDKPKRRRTRTRKSADAAPQEVVETVAEAVMDTPVAAQAAQEPAQDATPAKRIRSRRKPAVAQDAAPEPVATAEIAVTEDVPAPAKRRSRAKPKPTEPAPAAVPDPVAEAPTDSAPAAEPAPTPQPLPDSAPEPAADKPRRKGWWSLGK
ncbi:Ribonuclease E [Yoonia vestfoldensis SKA53]|uniref:Ribonuclease E n=2 Tax=Yoonia vestfoldensis TaxID=245188 RepID=A3V8K3_9RHOB|nr:Ribonuclease E [Yoonia vestfoldensis SKA53]